MSTFAKDQATVKALAKRISAIEPRDVSGIALVGLMTGVLYSLERSIELRFDDARTKKREGRQGPDPAIHRARPGQTRHARGRHGRAPARSGVLSKHARRGGCHLPMGCRRRRAGMGAPGQHRAGN